MAQFYAKQTSDDHNELALNAFRGSLVKRFSSTTVEPYASTKDQQDNPVQEYIVHEMTYNFALRLYVLII